MSPEQIAKIVWERHIGEQATHSSLDILTTVIKEAIGLHEASKWKHPSKGELPEVGVWISFYRGELFCFGCRDSETTFTDFIRESEYPKHQITKWQYAPEVE